MSRAASADGGPPCCASVLHGPVVDLVARNASGPAGLKEDTVHGTGRYRTRCCWPGGRREQRPAGWPGGPASDGGSRLLIADQQPSLAAGLVHVIPNHPGCPHSPDAST